MNLKAFPLPVIILIIAMVAWLSIITYLCYDQSRGDREDSLSDVSITAAPGRNIVFDRGDGKIYVYDESWQQCLEVLEFTALGEPLKKLPGN